MQFNLLHTARLTLREMNPRVYEHLFSSCNDQQLKREFGIIDDEGLELKKEQYSRGLTMFNKSFIYFQLLNKETGVNIGWCGFHTWYILHARAEIGYSLWDETDRGKGYMKEALMPILDFGFNKMNLHRIEAFVGSDNEASLRLIKSAGFTFEGHLREHYFTNNRFEDSLIFSLLKTEFK